MTASRTSIASLAQVSYEYYQHCAGTSGAPSSDRQAEMAGYQPSPQPSLVKLPDVTSPPSKLRGLEVLDSSTASHSPRKQRTKIAPAVDGRGTITGKFIVGHEADGTPARMRMRLDLHFDSAVEPSVHSRSRSESFSAFKPLREPSQASKRSASSRRSSTALSELSLLRDAPRHHHAEKATRESTRESPLSGAEQLRSLRLTPTESRPRAGRIDAHRTERYEVEVPVERASRRSRAPSSRHSTATQAQGLGHSRTRPRVSGASASDMDESFVTARTPSIRTSRTQTEASALNSQAPSRSPSLRSQSRPSPSIRISPASSLLRPPSPSEAFRRRATAPAPPRPDVDQVRKDSLPSRTSLPAKPALRPTTEYSVSTCSDASPVKRTDFVLPAESESALEPRSARDSVVQQAECSEVWDKSQHESPDGSLHHDVLDLDECVPASSPNADECNPSPPCHMARLSVSPVSPAEWEELMGNPELNAAHVATQWAPAPNIVITPPASDDKPLPAVPAQSVTPEGKGVRPSRQQRDEATRPIKQAIRTGHDPLRAPRLHDPYNWEDPPPAPRRRKQSRDPLIDESVGRHPERFASNNSLGAIPKLSRARPSFTQRLRSTLTCGLLDREVDYAPTPYTFEGYKTVHTFTRSDLDLDNMVDRYAAELSDR